MRPDNLEPNAKTRGRPKKMKENIAEVLDDEKVLLGLRIAFLEEVIRNQRGAIEADIEGEYQEEIRKSRHQINYRDDLIQNQIATITKQSRLIDKLQVTLDIKLGVDTEAEIEAKIRKLETNWTQFIKHQGLSGLSHV